LHRQRPLQELGSVDAQRPRGESVRRAAPPQGLDVAEKVGIGPEGGEPLEQHRILQLAAHTRAAETIPMGPYWFNKRAAPTAPMPEIPG
jgi:hypothetical protein